MSFIKLIRISTSCIVLGLIGCSSLSKKLEKPTAPELQELCRKGAQGACAVIGTATESVQSLSILQGVSSANHVRLNVMVPRKASVYYFLREMGGTPEGFEPIKAERFQRRFSDWALDELEVFDLVPTVTYQLIAIDGDGMLLDTREFRSIDLDAKKVRIGLISCTDEKLADVQKSMWTELIKQKPNVLFLIGDNVYADKGLDHAGPANPEDLWNRYSQMRGQLELYKIPQLIPTFAVWDDHDYGQNDGDRTYAFKEESKHIFFSFFPQQKPAQKFDRGPGVSSWLSAFGAHFAFLDDRSFRSPNNIDSPDQTHFGAAQEEWLKQQMKDVKAPVVLISGDQFFGGYHSFESYQGNHPKRFESHLKEWRNFRYPLQFWSGDRHLAEVIELKAKVLGYKTFELTSSGMHAKVFDDAMERNPDPNLLVGIDGQYNFMMIDWLSASPHVIKMKVSSYGLQNKVHFSRQLTIKH